MNNLSKCLIVLKFTLNHEELYAELISSSAPTTTTLWPLIVSLGYFMA